MDSPHQTLVRSRDKKVLSSLSLVELVAEYNFIKPTKKINHGHDIPHFLTSRAYRDIGIFVMQLNIAMCPRKLAEPGQVQTWQLDSPTRLSEPVLKLQKLLEAIDAMVDEVPPDTGPRRFGNVSFRKWFEILELQVDELLRSYLPQHVLSFGGTSSGDVSALDELTPYLLGGFGSAQRLDYGTGHELSFLAFLGCIWKLGGFTQNQDFPQDGSLERSIVIGVIEP
jgi:serine/threonine-protein phosphatase 2A activator